MKELTNIQELEKAVMKNGEMVVYKQNNQLMLMDMEEYKKNIWVKEIEQHLLKAEKEIEQGKYKNSKEVFEEWKNKYGI